MAKPLLDQGLHAVGMPHMLFQRLQRGGATRCESSASTLEHCSGMHAAVADVHCCPLPRSGSYATYRRCPVPRHVYSIVQQFRPMHQMMGPPRQRSHPHSNRAVRALDMRRVQQQTARIARSHHSLATILLDHLPDAQHWLGHDARRSMSTIMLTGVKGLPKDIDHHK